MHFHVPKPLHGWRAFVGEVGIIVVGVLIALGAEQVAEGWRWHERAEEGRERLKAEIGHEFLLMQEREAVGDCVDSQLNNLEKLVLLSGSKLKPAVLYSENQPPGLISEYVIRTPSRSWSDSAWQSIISEGLPEHLTLREREYLPIHYSQMARISAANHDEDLALGELRALSKPMQLDAGVRSAFIRMIEGERARNRFMANGSVQMIATVEKLHYVPTEQLQRDWMTRSGTVSFCRAHHLPLGKLPN